MELHDVLLRCRKKLFECWKIISSSSNNDDRDVEDDDESKANTVEESGLDVGTKILKRNYEELMKKRMRLGGH